MDRLTRMWDWSVDVASRLLILAGQGSWSAQTVPVARGGNILCMSRLWMPWPQLQILTKESRHGESIRAELIRVVPTLLYCPNIESSRVELSCRPTNIAALFGSVELSKVEVYQHCCVIQLS